VANPDIRLPADPFPQLLRQFADSKVAVIGPLVRNPVGGIEDSARRYPTFGKLAGKLFGGSAKADYPVDRGPIEVDWLAGMFLLFRAEAYRSIGGFDERYFLYYEDVDVCKRLKTSGFNVLYEPRAEVIHDARRGSRRNPRLASLHLQSAMRFLFTSTRH
jgi:GT2 family glycosyltransferase